MREGFPLECLMSIPASVIENDATHGAMKFRVASPLPIALSKRNPLVLLLAMLPAPARLSYVGLPVIRRARGPADDSRRSGILIARGVIRLTAKDARFLLKCEWHNLFLVSGVLKHPLGVQRRRGGERERQRRQQREETQPFLKNGPHHARFGDDQCRNTSPLWAR